MSINAWNDSFFEIWMASPVLLWIFLLCIWLLLFLGGVRLYHLHKRIHKKRIKKKKRRMRIRKDQQGFVGQLPLLMQGLSGALQAGYSLPQAFLFVEKDLDQPVKGYIESINSMLALQVPLEEALKRFEQEVKSQDVTFFVECTRIQIHNGGDLVPLLSKVQNVIEQKIKLERERKSLTAQGRWSAIIIALLWPVSLLFFSVFAPEQSRLLFETGTGQVFLSVSFLLEVFGLWWIWKIVNIKLSV